MRTSWKEKERLHMKYKQMNILLYDDFHRDTSPFAITESFVVIYHPRAVSKGYPSVPHPYRLLEPVRELRYQYRCQPKITSTRWKPADFGRQRDGNGIDLGGPEQALKLGSERPAGTV